MQQSLGVRFLILALIFFLETGLYDIEIVGFLWYQPLKIEYLDKGSRKFNPGKSFEFSNNLTIQESVQSEFCLNSKKNGLENRIILFGILKIAVFVIHNLNMR